MKEFYSSTLNGVDLKVKFSFSKVFFTKNYEDINNSVFYDVGVLSDIGWEENTSATPKYSLNMIKAMDITPGMSIVQGNMSLKTFHHDSLSLIKKEVLKGINGGSNKIEFPTIDDNPFLTLEDINDSIIYDVHSDPERINWSQMPLFDILLISSADNGQGKKEVRIKTIKGVKIVSSGFAESIESLEMNSMVSFIAVGGTTDWEVSNIE